METTEFSNLVKDEIGKGIERLTRELALGKNWTINNVSE
jgi:hypothetical protein